VLEAVAALEDGLAPVIPGSHGELPPAVARATLHASSVAEAMSTLQPVFQSGRLKAKNEGLVLEPGLNAECDAAAARLEASERVLEAAVDHARNALLAMANGTLPKGAKIKLVRSGINALLEAPVALKSYAPDGFVAVKETKTLVRFQVPAVITAAELVTDAIAESQEATLRYLQQVRTALSPRPLPRK